MTSTALALFEESDRPDGELPLLMQRPAEEGAVARLAWSRGQETKDGDRIPRWTLRGAIGPIVLAERLFSGANVNARRDAISWPDVPATFEDLLMLMHRYPIMLETSAVEAWNERYDDMLAGWRMRCGSLGDIASIGGGRFKGTLRDFQTEGVRFMLSGARVLLADDMGLGKTPQALAYLDKVDSWPAVIVCQSHVQMHWERKIEQFLDCRRAQGGLLDKEALTWVALRGTKADRNIPKAHIYLVHYLVMHGWEAFLISRGVKVVVFDEVQELRHPGTRKYESNRAVARQAKCVVGLSGTPIYNKGAEIYNVMNTINRGCLGTKVDFQKAWCDQSDPAVVTEPDVLGQYLIDRGLMLRRRKDDVLGELPEKRRVVEPIDADNATFAELLKEAVKLAKQSAWLRDPFEKAQMESMAIAKLRKATGVAKTPGVIAFLRGLMEAEQPTLVFSHHHAVHDAICDALEAFMPARITGEESIAQKDQSLKRFAGGETNLCLIALRAATGIDGLQERARVVVFAELDWSPAVHAQAEDRAHRMGQRDSVLVYYLTTELGSDPFVLGTLNIKEQQFLGLMQDSGETDEDRAAARNAAERHKAEMLAMLRGYK